MANRKLSELVTILAGALADGDLFPLIDISDTTDAASGSTKVITKAQLATLFDAAGAAAAAQAASQPLDSDLTAIAALSTTTFGRSLLALADAAAGRSALGLGTAATQATGAFDAAGAAAAAQAASQPLDSDLTAIAALSTTTYGRSLLTLASASALASTLATDTAFSSRFAPIPTRSLPWAPRASTDPSTIIYVDQAAGNDSTGDGSSATPYASLQKAFTIAANLDRLILVRAPKSNPTFLFATTSGTGTIVVDSWDYGQPWWMHGMATSTSGWTAVGGGIYSRTTSRTTVNVLSLSHTETVGDRTFYRQLTQNTVTPTTPAAGEFGYSSNVLYVHLWNDDNANSCTIMHPTTSTNTSPIAKTGAGTLTLRNGRFIAGNLQITAATAGTMNLESCEGIYAGSNGTFQWDGANGYAKDCRGWRSINDGFNVHGTSVVQLINCDGSYNEDEGASPHDTSSLTVCGGQYRYNGSGGVTAVGTSKLYVVDHPLFERNQRLNVNAGEGAITVHDSTVTGRIDSAVVRNNYGPGIIVKSGATFSVNTGLDIVTGTANGNASADNLAY